MLVCQQSNDSDTSYRAERIISPVNGPNCAEVKTRGNQRKHLVPQPFTALGHLSTGPKCPAKGYPSGSARTKTKRPAAM
jgi:hypothetical protein